MVLSSTSRGSPLQKIFIDEALPQAAGLIRDVGLLRNALVVCAVAVPQTVFQSHVV